MSSYSLLNGLLYVAVFRFKKIKYKKWYDIHWGIFTVCVVALVTSFCFFKISHYSSKYYAFDEFYKLRVIHCFNIAMSLSVALMILSQVLLPVNFICSLFKNDKITL